MTEILVGDITPHVQFTADGVQSAFAFPFPVLDAESLVVTFDGGEAASHGVSLAGSAGGTVTFDDPPPAGALVTLYRRTTIARATDFIPAGEFRAAAINEELDRLTMIAQEIDLRGRVALRASASDAALDMVLPPAGERANRVLGFDSEGRPNVSTPSAETAAELQGIADAAVAARDAAEGYAGDAAAAAASVSLPVATAQDAGKLLQVNAAGDGYELGGGFPVGTVAATISTSAPPGWLLLDGSTLGDAGSGADHAEAGYEALFALLYHSLANAEAPVSGGRGASAAADWAAGKRITLPDLRGRTLIGSGGGPSLTARTHGGSGGTESHVLTESQIPSHSHSGTTQATQGSDNVITDETATNGEGALVGQGVGGQEPQEVYKPGSTASHAHTHDYMTSSVGGGAAHPNMPPWLALNHIVKA